MEENGTLHCERGGARENSRQSLSHGLKATRVALLFKILGNGTQLTIPGVVSQGETSAAGVRKEPLREESRMSYGLRCMTACSLIGFRRDGKGMAFTFNESGTISDAGRVLVHELTV